MYQNPTLVKALVRDRVDEVRQSAEARAPRKRENRRHPIVDAARHGTGWLLVDLGLRLAVPRSAIDHRSA
jgi:hypothetical protein